MSMKPDLKYRCDACEEIHDDEYCANDCCRPTVSEVYLCPVCAECYLYIANANSYCDDNSDNDDTPVSPVSAAEREAAGQMRLWAA